MSFSSVSLGAPIHAVCMALLPRFICRMLKRLSAASRSWRKAALALLSTVTLCLTACGGGSGATTSTDAGSPVTIRLSGLNMLDGGQSSAIDATLMNDQNADGVTFALDGAGVLSYPPATILSSPKLSCYYTSPAMVTTKFTATITATSVRDKSKTAALSIVVYPTVTFAKVDPPQAFAGKPYSLQLQGGGGSGPITYVLNIFGSLPPGLNLDRNTGVISGTPTMLGTYPVGVQAQDANGAYTAAAQQNFTIQVS